eukprot:1716181-Rhodomonas_salina.2
MVVDKYYDKVYVSECNNGPACAEEGYPAVPGFDVHPEIKYEEPQFQHICAKNADPHLLSTGEPIMIRNRYVLAGTDPAYGATAGYQAAEYRRTVVQPAKSGLCVCWYFTSTRCTGRCHARY